MDALRGIRVLEWAPFFPGPYLAALLAELGADVVKVEPPAGDPGRHLPPMLGDAGFAYAAANGGKRTVAVDLKDPDGRAAMDELVRRADVLVQGHRPSTAARLGLDGDACLRLNPRLVYVELSGWGPDGAWADRPGHDLAYQALAGCLDAAEPRVPPTPTADVIGAFWGALLAVTALRDADATGAGRILRTSLAGAALAASALPRALAHALSGPTPGLTTGRMAPYNVYRCADGRWLALAILEPAWWRAFCEAADLPELADDPFPAEARAARTARDRVAAVIAREPRASWEERLAAAGVPFAPVLTPGEAPAALAGAGAAPPHLPRPEAARPPRRAQAKDIVSGWEPRPRAGPKH